MAVEVQNKGKTGLIMNRAYFLRWASKIHLNLSKTTEQLHVLQNW